MRRIIAVAIAAVCGALTIAAPSAARTSVDCRGDASVVPIPTSYEMRTSGPVTVTSFDFTGTHSLCNEAGSRVEGAWAGHIVQTALPDGRTLVFVRGHEEYVGATVDVASLIEISASGEWRVISGRASNGTGWLERASTNILEASPIAPGVLAFHSVITWH